MVYLNIFVNPRILKINIANKINNIAINKGVLLLVANKT